MWGGLWRAATARLLVLVVWFVLVMLCQLLLGEVVRIW